MPPVVQYGSGMAFRDYVYVDDVARAFVMAAFKDSKEVAGPDTFNIAGLLQL